MEDREMLLSCLRAMICLEERLADCRREQNVWEEKRRRCAEELWGGGLRRFLPQCREALGALAGLAGLCLGLALITGWLDLGYAAFFFRIATAAFLVSFLGLLAVKLLEGKRAFDSKRPQYEDQLRRCEWELALLDSREGEMKHLLEKLYNLGVFPEYCRSLCSLSRLYRELLADGNDFHNKWEIRWETVEEAVKEAEAFLNTRTPS